MPMIASRYPPNWPEISTRIRARAGDRCEWIDVAGRRCDARHGQWRGDNRRDVVLTVHHIDFDPSHNDDGNLMCLCEKHHLECHLAQQAENRRRAQRAAGQLELGLEA